MKSMGVATGCGCKEVHVYIYRFPHITYPYLVSVLFSATSLLFVHF